MHTVHEKAEDCISRTPEIPAVWPTCHFTPHYQPDIIPCWKRIASFWTWHLHLNFSLPLAVVREHEQAVIIVPTLLLFATLVTLLALCLLRYCPERKRTRVTAPQHYSSSSHRHTQRHNHRHHLQGIDGEQACLRLMHKALCHIILVVFSKEIHIRIYYSVLCLSLTH